jgi:preprotein translocase subunit SecG
VRRYFDPQDRSLEGGLEKGHSLLAGIVAALHAVISLALIFLILLHAGRGGGVSDMFGGGMSGSYSGSTVVERNLDRLTVIVAVAFAITTFTLTWMWR